MSISQTADYLAKNASREGTSVKLKITPEQQRELVACMRKDHGSYSVHSNNCGAPVQNCLKGLGIDTGHQILPVSLGNKLLDMNVVNGVKVHPATRPTTDWSAPWAR
jgi:hypothetical protein